MSRKRIKTRDKIVLKNSRDGAIERNLTRGEDTRISKRTVDFDLRGDAERDSFSRSEKSKTSSASINSTDRKRLKTARRQKPSRKSLTKRAVRRNCRK